MIKQENIKMIILDSNLFDGYISEVGNGVFISHISSRNPGHGDFSNLLKELKRKYPWIKVPTPSIQMQDILLKKGFVRKFEFFEEPFNCEGMVMFWENQNGY